MQIDMKRCLVKAQYSLGRFKSHLNESGETMPAKIVNAAVTSVLLLLIASIISLVVQEKSKAESEVNLDSAQVQIETSFTSDLNNATYIREELSLVQPDERLLEKDDVAVKGVNLHIPESSGECKAIRWDVDSKNQSIVRNITIYEGTKNNAELVECDENSAIIGERAKSFGDDTLITDPIVIYNKLDRELTFSMTPEALESVNTELEAQLVAQGVDRLSDEELGMLRDNMAEGSFIASNEEPDSCVMDEPKTLWEDENGDGIEQGTELHCEAPENANVEAEWKSTDVSTASFNFRMIEDGESE